MGRFKLEKLKPKFEEIETSIHKNKETNYLRKLRPQCIIFPPISKFCNCSNPIIRLPRHEYWRAVLYNKNIYGTRIVETYHRYHINETLRVNFYRYYWDLEFWKYHIGLLQKILSSKYPYFGLRIFS